MAEGRWLRSLLLGDEPEVRLLARVSGRRVIAAARSDLGPVPVLAGATPERMRALARRWGIERILTIDAEAEDPGREIPDLLERLLDPGVRAEPAWSAGLAALLVRTRRRWLGRWLLADGAYGLISPACDGAELQVICLRLRAGRVDRIVGRAALGLEPGSGIDRVVPSIRRRVGKPQLVISGRGRALRRWLESAHLATALERAVLRGWLRIEQRSAHALLALTLLRMRELRGAPSEARASQA
ncbi:MAG: hypothetical protein ACE5IL_15295 [Myxococcota bacterium]